MRLARRLVLGALRALPRCAELRHRLAGSTVAAPSPAPCRPPSPRRWSSASTSPIGCTRPAPCRALRVERRAWSSSNAGWRSARKPRLGSPRRGHRSDRSRAAAEVHAGRQLLRPGRPRSLRLHRRLRRRHSRAARFPAGADRPPAGPRLRGRRPARTWTATSTMRSRCAGRGCARARPASSNAAAGLVPTGRRRLLLPFDDAARCGLRLRPPRSDRPHGLAMGIVDALPIDHSLRAQAAAYDSRTSTRRWRVSRGDAAPVDGRSVHGGPRYPRRPDSDPRLGYVGVSDASMQRQSPRLRRRSVASHSPRQPRSPRCPDPADALPPSAPAPNRGAARRRPWPRRPPIACC